MCGVSVACMKRRQLLVSSIVGIVTCGFSGCVGGGTDAAPSVPEDANVPDYEVAQEEDTGNAATTRIERKIVVSSVDYLSDDDLRLVAVDNVAEITDSQTVDAVTVFFYEEGDDIQGAASARVEWAPGGDISQAGEVPAGNYDEYEFSVERLSGQF